MTTQQHTHQAGGATTLHLTNDDLTLLYKAAVDEFPNTRRMCDELEAAMKRRGML